MKALERCIKEILSEMFSVVYGKCLGKNGYFSRMQVSVSSSMAFR
jgi:hypothetical protein